MNIHDIYILYIVSWNQSTYMSFAKKQYIYLNEYQSNLFTSLPIMHFGYIRFENCKDVIYRYNEKCIYFLLKQRLFTVSNKAKQRTNYSTQT